MLAELNTLQGEALLEQPEKTPWEVYPRPQCRRASWQNLNGLWRFCASRNPEFPESYPDTIRVPFCPESRLSGLGRHFEEGSWLHYAREFALPEDFRSGRLLLHIGAADQIAEVFVNGRQVCRHVGGYEAFTADITEFAKEENLLQIRCQDDLRSTQLPYGKQVMKRGGMWYTPVSGIWQTVWLEWVPQAYIEKLHIENRGKAVTISVEPKLAGTVTVAGLGSYPLTDGAVTITPESPRLWSPEDPFLYTFAVETEQDRVESYFALRVLEMKKTGKYQRLCLNGKPYFFHGLLDQGYWPDGLFTPAEPGCYAEDILAMKALGFNTLRKHIKVEPEEFYYQCDRLGMVVFQDMVNNGDYGYIRDTVLPTVGLQVLPDRWLHRDGASREAFLQGMEATVKQLKNHPSILYWTIFNEGWGQFDSDRVYGMFRLLDDTRWIDSTSGWFRRRRTDVDSRHVYFRRVRLTGGEKPLVLSEFGGYSLQCQGHTFNPEQVYGYGKYREREDWAQAVVRLYLEQIVPCAERGLCAAIYTQVSDVEDETNGLVSYDRKVRKLTPEEMLPVAARLHKAVEEAI